ncbi:uncharacterized protein BXZ73DRAFT_80781 [Epithele typhae]|uniref:uncharacterized protein n=1 Tax=Epithele typhae TaxID=378194 RepID=UPI002008AE7C|nr:uncharacterized protein BXZ73DRAFT_80781 [Epithele typhae]KAH9917658.1 hypothetical protein BXZ73DRAFT_80781 [Epithele typhae]
MRTTLVLFCLIAVVVARPPAQAHIDHDRSTSTTFNSSGAASSSNDPPTKTLHLRNEGGSFPSDFSIPSIPSDWSSTSRPSGFSIPAIPSGYSTGLPSGFSLPAIPSGWESGVPSGFSLPSGWTYPTQWGQATASQPTTRTLSSTRRPVGHSLPTPIPSNWATGIPSGFSIPPIPSDWASLLPSDFSVPADGAVNPTTHGVTGGSGTASRTPSNDPPPTNAPAGKLTVDAVGAADAQATAVGQSPSPDLSTLTPNSYIAIGLLGGVLTLLGVGVLLTIHGQHRTKEYAPIWRAERMMERDVPYENGFRGTKD